MTFEAAVALPQHLLKRAAFLALVLVGNAALAFEDAGSGWVAPNPRQQQLSTIRQLKEWGLKIPEGLKYNIPAKQYIQPDSGPPTHPVNASEQAAADNENRQQQLLRKRCAVTRGTWCGHYLHQERIASKPVPRGAKECPNACSGWGNCNYDTGICECPAGRGSHDCGTSVKRPCTNRGRALVPPNTVEPMSHMRASDHSDLNVTEPGWMGSRCYGYCNDDIALCFCGENSKYRHIPAPEGSPPWTPPVQWGRALSDSCMIGVDKDGSTISWGRPSLRYDDLYGPQGWCNMHFSKVDCGCPIDGFEIPCDGSLWHEAFCVNQCSGHGECYSGFCRCHPGWYGQDCSRKKAGLPMEAGTHESQDPRLWLVHVVATPPAARAAPVLPTRARPLIYVYDMPPEYTSRMLQYRNGPDACMYRRFAGVTNGSILVSATYSVEVYLHELMLQSEHRTFDPEEADFFYMPMYVTCYFWPILGMADYPWWYAPAGNRPMHGANMILEAKRWLQEKHPWWDRRGGRDHIWLMSHDEGACWMPTEVYNTSIVLTHWGRMELEHRSNTAYSQDNYTVELSDDIKAWRGGDLNATIYGHPCYNPHKDLVIPAFKPPAHFLKSPLMGHPPLERDILFYFRGDVGQHRDDVYSRGIRQKIFTLAMKDDWATKYSIFVGPGGVIEGDYSEHLARSKFCLVAPGDGWSPRAEDAVLHGCVPVVIMDNVHAVFESILDWDSFSIRVKESAVEHLPKILAAVTPEKLLHMQHRLARVWHRFAYQSGPTMRKEYARLYAVEPNTGATYSRSPLPHHNQFPMPEDDAFHTILQWLYHRIPDTR